MAAISGLSRLADRFDPPPPDRWRWVCDREECEEGEPHDGLGLHARTKQRPPEGDWFVWLILAGRGWGKTRTGAEWLARQASTDPDPRAAYAVVGRTRDDVRSTCLEGRSGLLAALGLTLGSPEYNRVTGQIRLPSGPTIDCYSAEKPAKLRGPNLSGAWCDELAVWQYQEQVWKDVLAPALRIGDQPRVVVTTTPMPTPLIRELVARRDGSVVHTRGATRENVANLSEAGVDELYRQYEGTRLGRQELEGELIEDVEGALWSARMLDACRVSDEQVPELSRLVVAVDPAGSSRVGADDTGIVVVGKGVDGECYVLADRTCHLPPEGWGQRAVRAYHRFEADLIVAEQNFGAEMVEHVIRTVDPTVPVKLVKATDRKRVRAQPVAALFGAPPKRPPRVHMVGVLPQLEAQLMSWTPEDSKSPDRLDALVWAITELMLEAQGSWRPL